ncbi:MAG: agmatinase family protein [Dongiaceae bacterium]
MNPAKSYAHLFSPLGGDDADNYRAPGQITFLRAPHVPMETAALKKCGARYAFVGVPFDEGNVGKPGSEDGPREFRIASQEYFSYWFEFGVDLHGVAVDCGDVQMPKVSPETAHAKLYRAVRTVLAAGLIPIVVGGDRSISISVARALSDHIGGKKKMGCLHFGAHLDMAESWAGERMVSTCTLARITELPNLAAANVAHIGARNSMNPKDYIDLAKARGIRFYPMFEVLDRGIDTVAADAINKVWKGTDAQYLSFNFNVMDASDAPGVTAAEPGGLESREMMRVADALGKRKNVSVIDVTELCPVFDVSGTTARLAVCMVLRIMAAQAKARGELLDPKIRRSDLTKKKAGKR